MLTNYVQSIDVQIKPRTEIYEGGKKYNTTETWYVEIYEVPSK
jgi:hypothetical protein